MDLMTQTGVKRAVCFDERRYPLFNELNNNQTHGVLIKRPLVDKNDDIIITDFSKTTKIEVDHIEIKEPKVTTIADALSQKSVFERFHLKGVLSKV